MAERSRVVDARVYGLNLPLGELASALQGRDVVGVLVSRPQTAVVLVVWALSHGYSLVGVIDTGKGVLVVLSPSGRQLRGAEAHELLGDLLREVYQVKPPESIACLEEASQSLLDPVMRARLILRGEHVATQVVDGLEGLLEAMPRDEGCYLLRIDAGQDTIYLITCGGKAVGCTINENYAEPDVVAERVEHAGRIRVHVYRLPEDYRPPAVGEEESE